MKTRYAIIALAVILLGYGKAAYAQRTSVREEVLSDWNKSSGLDCIYDFSKKHLTPAPKGYEAVYIGHYGRHGSRYAYSGDAYRIIHDMLLEGLEAGNLTAYGKTLQERMVPFWENVRYRVGDLTALGWEQNDRIGAEMVKAYPSVFRKGSFVDACSSPSVRSILSMSACCGAISRLAPQVKVYEHQGMTDLQATRPNMGGNPFMYEGPESVFPYGESSREFFLRRFPGYRDVLARLFKDPDKALGERDPYTVFFHLYMFVAGMNSLPEAERMDVDGFFTKEEFATLWEIDNYERFREYHSYRTACSSIVDDMVEKASEALASGVRGVHLRYGHDHVVMPLEMIMDIDGFDEAPADADDLVYYFQTFRSPMAANIQMVLFKPVRGSGDVLAKVLLNGEEVRLGDLRAYSWPYYRWEDMKAYLKERTDRFVYRDGRPEPEPSPAPEPEYLSSKTTVAPGTPVWSAADQARVRTEAYSHVNYNEEAVPSYTLPDPLVFSDGRKVTSRKQWPSRRREILEIFQSQMFGVLPPPHEIYLETLEEGPAVAATPATRRQVRMWFSPDRTGPKLDWLIITPDFVQGPVPAVLLLNYGGNHEVLPDKQILLPESWLREAPHKAAEETRGRLNHDSDNLTIFPVSMLLARGYALVTCCYCDISPDPDPLLEDNGKILQDTFAYSGVFELWGERDPSRDDNTSSLMAWAWGLMRGMDMIEKDPRLDESRVVLTGYSRLGKAALVAGAFDDRFPVTVPIQTGGGGVPLAKRHFGETIATEVSSFRHWYCRAYDKYAYDTASMPFDQHMLLSCFAPRALLVEGFNQGWFDTRGEFLAVQAASPVWKLLGQDGLPAVAWPGDFDTLAVGKTLGYVRRAGGHGIASIDWIRMLDFADGVFSGKATSRK